jgi:hypothetical protein
MKHINAVCEYDIQFYVKAGGTLCLKGIIMSLRFGTEGLNRGHALSKQMRMVSQVRAWLVWFNFA